MAGRILFSKEDMNNPVFGYDYIDSVLDRLEYFEEYVEAGLGDEIQLGPYTVFTSSSAPSSRCGISEGGKVNEDGEASEDGEAGEDGEVREHGEAFSSYSQATTADSPEVEEILESTLLNDTPYYYMDRPAATLMLQQRLLPFVEPFLSSASVAERRLLHFWVTSGSSIMTCTDHPENPFRQLVIPIALEAAASSHALSGHAALLHIVYAFAGFHHAQLDQSDPNIKEIATNHYHAGLRHLRKSLTQDPHTQYDAILAVVIILISIDTLNGQSGQWQIHMRGAREWLREIDGAWDNHRYGHVMYQMFECLEIMGHAQNPNRLLASNATHNRDSNTSRLFSLSSEVNDTPYCLDKFFGITKPVLKMIMKINRLLGSNPTPGELAIIEDEILLANPSILRFPGLKDIEQITRHHSCTVYYSGVIYYQRSILHQPLSDIQYLVEQSLYHLEVYTELTEHKSVAGLCWPVCVTACEAEEVHLRLRCIEIMDRKLRHGIKALSRVKEVVLEVWRLRDGGDCAYDILWQDVMKDMEIDILLC